jgi:diaminopimelate epimerase
MGEPDFTTANIPVKTDLPVFINKPVEALGMTFYMTCVSMGNPHAVTFVDDVDAIDIEKIGPVLENHDMFPKRANIEFIQCISSDMLKMRVWERGSGETLACGTGASASTAAAVVNGKSGRKVKIQLLGGVLELEWNESDNHIYMTGPAQFVYDGQTL